MLKLLLLSTGEYIDQGDGTAFSKCRVIYYYHYYYYCYYHRHNYHHLHRYL